ncbi:MAG: anhydro-N-acetylmuramic acid kinase [Erysipelotrichales bacterium]|nr:anhydro-N-acetylmuramic acid kinase [Erysipelotrichales bacterium]
MKIIGMMSGTSLDGVDLVYVEFNNKNNQISHRVISNYSRSYPKSLKTRLLAVSSKEKSNVQMICAMNFELGEFYGETVVSFMETHNLTFRDIDYISNHGQTIWHNPFNLDSFHSSTLQIGESSVIAALANIPVIDNFRVMDMALGGQGAPLIPYSEYLIYSNKSENICLQNIGGIGNITYLKKAGSIEDVVAFDTGPGNMLIDQAMQHFFNKAYDSNGDTAKKGELISDLFAFMKNDDYYQKCYPKSTGREKYSSEYFSKLLKIVDFKQFSKEDFVYTVTYFTAYTISLGLKFFPETDKLVIAGGGAYNKTLLSMIKELTACSVYTQEELGYDSQYKEALGFAFLGFACANGLFGNIKNVTGAKRSAILGKITPV